MGHELVGSALCGQVRLRAPRGRGDGETIKLNTKKGNGIQRMQETETGQRTGGEWGWSEEQKGYERKSSATTAHVLAELILRRLELVSYIERDVRQRC